MEPAPQDLAALAERCAALVSAAHGTRRRVLGIAGPPGAGKTTLVTALLAAAAGDPRLAGRVAHLPMDGFHLPSAQLRSLGRLDRKGAPDTFDAEAYAAVLAAVRSLPRRVVAGPAFDHSVGEPEAGGVSIPVEADLVLTEGNYLLLDDPAWRPLRSHLDEVWYCALDDRLRRDRLISRHVGAGRGLADATTWVDRSDEANARRVAATVEGADLVLVDGRVLERRAER